MRTALFDSPWGPVAVSILVGCLTLVAAMIALARPRGAWLRSRLEPYGAARTTSAPPAGAESAWRPNAARVRGMVDKAIRSSGLAATLERRLERANLRLRPVELVFWSAAGGVGAAVLLTLISSSTVLGLLAFMFGLLVPSIWVSVRGAHRMRAFDAQLPDILMTMSGSLKVGQSFSHSVRSIVEEGQAPAGEEFERVLNETRLGSPMDEALTAMADRIDSEDLRFVLLSVNIQNEVGGSLAELFQTVSDTVRERQQFRRKVRALTAMGRASAYLLLIMPFATAALITLISPSYMGPLYQTGIGQVLLVIMLVMMAIGALVLRKIVDVKG